jgi:kinesin family protein 5
VLGDLAGSERIKKTQVRGVRLDEAKMINRSLTTLGMVINSLTDGSKHVPYRDSKLTRVLQESLGGNSRTALIVCCAPERDHGQETISTLRFGERASRIKNKIVRNEELSVSELKEVRTDTFERKKTGRDTLPFPLTQTFSRPCLLRRSC